MAVSTRFAPSPTGVLHIGSARTALFAWLFAKRHQGQFVLRIEDTDRQRSTDASVAAILDGMAWLGLKPDQGPFYQTERLLRYRQVIDSLLESGHAYHCCCSKERLESLRAQQMQAKEQPRYDGRCRDCALAAMPGSSVVRFKNPRQGTVDFHDLVYGDISVANQQLDDLIIARSDGMPTYNLTVVVDDWDMQISHVIRGEDHVNNTPRQINILAALGAPIPVYAHIPMILGADGKRLSKRHGATGVMEYRQQGFLPEALLNYLVRLGWSHGDQEIFSLQEMINHFSLEAVNKSAAAMNLDKLSWLNQHYIKTLPLPRLADELAWSLQQLGVQEFAAGPPLTAVVEVQQQRAKSLVEMAEKSVFFYQDFADYAAKAKKHLKASVQPALQAVIQRLSVLEDWQQQSIHDIVISTAEEFSLKLGKLAQPMRVALTGDTVSPAIADTIYLLAREKVLQRLQQAIDWISNNTDSDPATE